LRDPAPDNERGNAAFDRPQLQCRHGDGFEAGGMNLRPTMKTNRDIERHYFEQFRGAYGLPNGAVEYADKPDVLLKGERTIGIEMTRFYLQPGGSPGRE